MAGFGDEGKGDGDVGFFRNPSWRVKLLSSTHAKYNRHVIFGSLPDGFEEYDTQRLNFLHFAIASLDTLNALDILRPEEKTRVIEWIYLLQITSEDELACGFQGSPTFIYKPKNNLEDGLSGKDLPSQLYSSHVTMTFAALVSLLTLGDDLSRVNREKILQGVGALQNKDGSFRASLGCSESDMRFVYSAVAICYVFQDFSTINVPKLLGFIQQSFTYEGSFGSGYAAEGHAAYTFCAVASLVLLNKLRSTLSEKQIERLKHWCVFRQTNGFTGRPGKDEDTCYSFWVGATLALLDSLDLSGRQENTDWLLHNQNPMTGGFGKHDNEFPDPLHTYMGIAGLSLINYPDLKKLFPALTISQDTAVRLVELQKSWKN